jgi:hypothetical protein
MRWNGRCEEDLQFSIYHCQFGDTTTFRIVNCKLKIVNVLPGPALELCPAENAI